MPGTLYLGTSNVVVPAPSKAYFPPEYQDKTRLTYYGALFNSVEINSTFYRLPQAKTLRKWLDEVPEDFRFTLKLWREVTHSRRFGTNDEELERFMEIAGAVGAKKGALLIQLPPKLTDAYSDHLEKILETVEELDPESTWPKAVEFRNLAWYTDSVYDLLDAHNASIVLHDMPTGTMELNEGAPFVYIRYHGPGGDYRGSYEEDFLSDHAEIIREYLAGGKDVYAYFNNTMGTAPRDALRLRGLITNS